jgi:hypothetical protein
MQYPLAFFELNLEFAHKAAEVTGQPWQAALLHYTNLYIRFGLGRDFDPCHPAWQAYLHGLREASDPAGWTCQFYRQRPEPVGLPPGEVAFGCFSYTLWDAQRVRLHFHNADPAPFSPLSRDRLPHRCRELSAMFAALRARVDPAAVVIGGSWLYNLEAYCRLFPPAFVASARPGDGDFPYLTLWGQFLDRHGQVKLDLAETFHQRLAQPCSLEHLVDCFPYPVLYLEAPLQVFYEYYGV